MKLLFDANLSPMLVGLFEDAFPETKHVREIGMISASDAEIWDYARAHGFCIVTKDTDFLARSVRDGGPPAVCIVRLGNSSTSDVAELLRAHQTALLTLEQTDRWLVVLET